MAALLGLGGGKGRHIFQFVLVDSSLSLLFSTSFSASFLTTSGQCQGQGYSPAVMSLCGESMDSIPAARMEVETEDATHTPKGHENTAVFTSGDFLGRGGQSQARTGSCGLRESRSLWPLFLLRLRVGLSLPGLNCKWASSER